MSNNKCTELRLFLVREGLTQRKIAKDSGLPESTVSLIASGRLRPSPLQLIRLSEALRRPISEVARLVE